MAHDRARAIAVMSEPAVSAPPRAKTGPVALGLGAIAVAVVGLAGWGTTVPLASAVVAQGQIVVGSMRKTIQHRDGGRVSTVRVRDGDKVQAGDVLVEVDGTTARTRLNLTRMAYYSARATQARLVAERDGSVTVAFPTELSEAATKNGDIAAVLEAQKRIFATRRQEQTVRRDVLVQQKAQFAHEITGLRAERESVTKQITLAEAELSTLMDLLKKKHTTRMRVHSMRRELAQLVGQKGRLSAQIARAQKGIAETELEILQLAKAHENEVAQLLRETEQQMFDRKEQLTAAADTASHLQIRAPVSGTIVNSVVAAAGQVIKPAEVIMEVVPDEDKLVAEVHVEPRDIDSIAVGQNTEVRLTAYRDSKLPALAAHVIYVSADAHEDPRSGRPYYLAKIEIERSKNLTGDVAPIPGMPAEALIKTGERTAMAYLMQPLLESMNRAWRED